MKRIFSSQNPMVIHLMKNLLELEGIMAIVRNENLTTALGGIPATECWVELWILDESREAEARDIIRKEQKSEDTAMTWPWICSRCGENIEGQFTECWNCGESRSTAKKGNH
jgi:anaerobic ribonucleoside-triphosphate reductase